MRRLKNHAAVLPGHRFGCSRTTWVVVRRDRSGRALLRNESEGSEEWMRIAAVEGMIASGTFKPLGKSASPKPAIPFYDRPWLSIPDVARWLKKGRAWVEDRIAAGDFVTVKDGERFKVATQSVQEYISRKIDEQKALLGLVA